jgi:hypothetical protein
MLFLNSWRVSVVPYYVTTRPPAIQKQHWHSREAQIEPPLFECECECGFRIQALVFFWQFEHQPRQICTFAPTLRFSIFRYAMYYENLLRHQHQLLYTKEQVRSGSLCVEFAIVSGLSSSF